MFLVQYILQSLVKKQRWLLYLHYGMNQFYKLWVDATKRNDYIRDWSSLVRVRARDENWKEQTIRNTSEEQFQQEFECEFLGSVDTLIKHNEN